MPAGVSDFGGTAWMSALFGVIDPIADYWLALCAAEPGIDMDGDILADLEPVDPAYIRAHYGTGPDAWAVNGPYLTNTLDIAFALPSVDWGSVTHYALCTAPSGGDLYAWGEFLNPQQLIASNLVLIPAGSLVLNLGTLDNSIAI